MKRWRGAIALVMTVLLFSGCALREKSPAETVEVLPEVDIPGEQGRISYTVEPETFEISILMDGGAVSVCQPILRQPVEGFSQNGAQTKWSYPQGQASVTIEARENYLLVDIESTGDGDHTFQWPKISGDSFYLPLGEGKRIIADDAAWTAYLSGEKFDVLEQLSMPFWAAAQGDKAILYIMENPFHNTLSFAESDTVSFTLEHTYLEMDKEKQNRFRIYLTENDPVVIAKLYKNYVAEHTERISLEEKAAANPAIRKLYGAPHIYLAGDFILSPADVNWPAFRQMADSAPMNDLATFAQGIESKNEFFAVLREIKNQDYVGAYQKNIICRSISEILRLENYGSSDQRISGADLPEAQILRFKKEILAESLPNVFQPVDRWMNNETVDILQEMKQAGIENAWIGLHSWEQAIVKPELVGAAADNGYLIAPYDSYHSIHKPGEEQWITAAFPEASLYENATIADKEGKKISGFQNVGRKLNPTLSLPWVEERVSRILGNSIPFNSWFIDCDATGEIYDDYSLAHPTTMRQDLQARLERMRYIRDRQGMVIGSEGGHDFAASTIAFAHGIELKSFSWMDEEMKKDQQSDYYIGKYYSPAGGVPEHFSKRVPVKENLYAVFVDPRYDIPLYKLVYNDVVITTYHWDWSTFKIVGATKDRMLRELLYNVPPLYHLDGTEWQNYKEEIIAHTKVWSDFSKQVITSEMTGFVLLSEDGLVQRTEYGDTAAVVANFSDTTFIYQQTEIPAHSALLSVHGEDFVYTPAVISEHA